MMDNPLIKVLLTWTTGAHGMVQMGFRGFRRLWPVKKSNKLKKSYRNPTLHRTLNRYFQISNPDRPYVPIKWLLGKETNFA
jgi:hypothetical protein